MTNSKPLPFLPPLNIPNLAPATHTQPSHRKPTIPLPMHSSTNQTIQFQIPQLTTPQFLIPPIPSGLMNDLPLPPELQTLSLPPIPSKPPLPPKQWLPPKPPFPPKPSLSYHLSLTPLIGPQIPHIPIPHTTLTIPKPKRKRKRKRKKSEINPISHNSEHKSEFKIDESLPLGHPKRIQFKDTISEAFSAKYKKQKRSVMRRSWARSKQCRDCNITYPSADDYELHRMVSHSEGIEIDYQCPVCGHGYRERRWLNRHVRNTHFKHVCKVDGHGQDQCGEIDSELRKRKGRDKICGFRFQTSDDLQAHQAIIHSLQNEYVQVSGTQGPTIQFMNGSEAKSIVIERLAWKESSIDLTDITSVLGGKKGNKSKRKRRVKPIKSKSKSRSKSPKKSRKKKSKSKSKSKSVEMTKRTLLDLPPSLEPPVKKQKINENERL